jgi:hypothetical protein
MLLDEALASTSILLHHIISIGPRRVFASIALSRVTDHTSACRMPIATPGGVPELSYALQRDWTTIIALVRARIHAPGVLGDG